MGVGYIRAAVNARADHGSPLFTAHHMLFTAPKSRDSQRWPCRIGEWFWPLPSASAPTREVGTSLGTPDMVARLALAPPHRVTAAGDALLSPGSLSPTRRRCAPAGRVLVPAVCSPVHRHPCKLGRWPHPSGRVEGPSGAKSPERPRSRDLLCSRGRAQRGGPTVSAIDVIHMASVGAWAWAVARGCQPRRAGRWTAGAAPEKRGAPRWPWTDPTPISFGAVQVACGRFLHVLICAERSRPRTAESYARRLICQPPGCTRRLHPKGRGC